MNIKNATVVFAASLTAAAVFAQEQEAEQKDAEAPAAESEGAEVAVKKPAPVGFSTLPFCRAVTGVAEILKPGASAWEPVEEGRFYPLFLGGLLLGIIESFAKAYISTQLANTIVFAVLIVVLLVRPAGLLGKYVPEKV